MKIWSLFLFILPLSLSFAGNDSLTSSLTQTPYQLPSRQLPDFSRLNPSQLNSILREGGWSGNGSDKIHESQNIWFLGDREIGYCLKVDSSYPLKQKHLEELVDDAFTQWKKFFNKYHLDKKFITGQFPRPRMNGLVFKDQVNRGLNLNFKKKPCDQSKLIFLFGQENPLISSYKKWATEHPFGLALRMSYDFQSYENPGYIWISNFSTSESRVKHIVLHELGHIFGMPHDSVFVMNEEVADQVSNDRLFSDSFFGRIESGFWSFSPQRNKPLVLSSLKGRRLRHFNRTNGRVSPMRSNCLDDSFQPNRLLPRMVQRRFGFDPTGCHKILFTLKGGKANRPRVKVYQLVIQGQEGRQRILLTGEFKPTKGVRPEFKGPGLYGPFKRGDRTIYRRLTLAKKPSLFPATGSFTYANKVFPAKIFEDKGLVIEIFLPRRNTWWTLRSSDNS